MRAFTLLTAGLIAAISVACGDTVEIARIGNDAESIDSSRVPESIRHLSGLAEEWTLDDTDRADRIDALSEPEKQAIIARVDPHLDAIDGWVDSHDPAAMPEEVSAFFWMRLAVEEMRY